MLRESLVFVCYSDVLIIVALSVRIFRNSVVGHECTWDIYNYGEYINQFPPNTIKAIRQYERINKKI